MTALEPALGSGADQEDLFAEMVGAYIDHRPRLAAVATRQSYGTAEGEDVVQDIFASLCAHPERFDAARGPLIPLLFTRARTRAVDVSRSERARRKREEQPIEGLRPLDSERIAVDRVIAERLNLALARLPRPQREVIVLTYFGNYSSREVADMTGMPVGTVKSRIFKGLRRLRDDLAADGLTADELVG